MKMNDKYKKLLTECLEDADEAYSNTSNKVSAHSHEGRDAIVKDFALMLFIARAKLRGTTFVFR